MVLRKCMIFKLLDEFLRVIRFKGIERRPLFQRQTGLPTIQFLTVLVQFFGEFPDFDAHGADPFAGAAIRASTCAVVSPQQMKRPHVGCILALADPLRPGFVHKTGGAVAQGAGVPACVAANAGSEQVLEIIPFLIWRHGFDAAHGRIRVNTCVFGHFIPDQFVINNRVAMGATRAVLLKHIAFDDFFRKSGAGNRDGFTGFFDGQDVSLEHGRDFMAIDHAGAGYADDIELFAFNLVFNESRHLYF